MRLCFDIFNPSGVIWKFYLSYQALFLLFGKRPKGKTNWNIFPRVQITVCVNTTKLYMIHSSSFHLLPLLGISMKVQWIRGKSIKSTTYIKKTLLLLLLEDHTSLQTLQSVSVNQFVFLVAGLFIPKWWGRRS